jgi:hypothetical protein
MSESSNKRLSWSKSEKYNDPMNIELGIMFQVLQELRAVTRSAEKHENKLETIRKSSIYKDMIMYGGGYVGKQLRRIKAVLSPDYGRKRSAYKAVTKETTPQLWDKKLSGTPDYNSKILHLVSEIEVSLSRYNDFMNKIKKIKLSVPMPISTRRLPSSSGIL